MPRESLDALQKELDALKEAQRRAEGQAAEYENALLKGENDQRLVFALRDSFDALTEIAFDRGKIEARMDDIRERDSQTARAAEEKSRDDDWIERLRNEEERSPNQEKERVAAVAEREWWQPDDPQEGAAAEAKYQDWVKSREDPDHVDDLDEPTPTRPR